MQPRLLGRTRKLNDDANSAHGGRHVKQRCEQFSAWSAAALLRAPQFDGVFCVCWSVDVRLRFHFFPLGCALWDIHSVGLEMPASASPEVARKSRRCHFRVARWWPWLRAMPLGLRGKLASRVTQCVAEKSPLAPNHRGCVANISPNLTELGRHSAIRSLRSTEPKNHLTTERIFS